MPISKPTLPPKAGYVERIDSNGFRRYVPVSKTISEFQNTEKMESLAQENKKIERKNFDLQTLLDTILGVNEIDDR